MPQKSMCLTLSLWVLMQQLQSFLLYRPVLQGQKGLETWMFQEPSGFTLEATS